MKKYSQYKKTEISWVKEFPEHWQEVDTKRCFLFPKTIVGEDFPNHKVLSLSVNGVIFRDMESRMGKHHSDMGTYQIIKPNSIVLCLFDMDVTPRIVGHSDKTGIITSAYTNIIPKNNVDSKYYYYYYLLQDYNNYLFSQGTGIRTTLTRSQFGALKIALPPKQEQTTIANFLDYKTEKINRFITKKKQLIELLNEQKAAIINQAVTKGINPNMPMKDSGIEWLGEIPEHWEIRKLKYDYTLNGRIGYHGLNSSDFIDQGIKLITGTDLINKNINWNTCYCVDEKWYEVDPLIQLSNGELLVTKDGTIGKTAIISGLTEKAILNSGLFVVRHKNSDIIDNIYLQVLINSIVFKLFVDLNKTGSTVQHLYQKTFYNFPMVVPPKAEQKIIVNFIETETKKIDKTISTIEKEIALVEEYKTALIEEAVTGKIDVRDFKVPTQETPLAMVAEEATNYNKR